MKPNLLLTNDDGIGAPGLHALFCELREIANTTIVAPLVEQSAVGHAITMSDPLRVSNYEREGGFYGYAVKGTPADCVKIAYCAIMDQKPDMLVSGINLGENTGINTIYSGTVSAATEGAMLGIPAFAISLDIYDNPDFQYAAKFASALTRSILQNGLPRGVCLNVNVPACHESEIEGITVTKQGLSVFQDQFDRRVDPHGRVYYWLTGQKVDIENDKYTDEGAVRANKVSITPIHYDLTHYAFIDTLRKWDIKP
ncbi:5'/3'-nucleotidase SurE [bacterium]|nr:5'/3'-nucleotidase SurE [bacterium]RQV93669.1 MAG: 5'/3'-nucleotidase SurE [bacterium]